MLEGQDGPLWCLWKNSPRRLEGSVKALPWQVFLEALGGLKADPARVVRAARSRMDPPDIVDASTFRNDGLRISGGIDPGVNDTHPVSRALDRSLRNDVVVRPGP